MRRKRVMAVTGIGKRRYYELKTAGILCARRLQSYRREERVSKASVLAFLATAPQAA